ncbi:endonuclease [Cereibacter changlensis JA139]|uniref:Endonuclease n=2 Tax=Cereibacter changlensis TaxID=402884 RepID=A0A2T4JY81_9RHOB|nr:endonuclease/exonuclease/phosphatase family protein [Cereibacter changlensis]PTE22879.1 endonuclease [Cereibacter changlensis JA139]PZX55296.1 Endonuclease/Exonuclease/phosphatase family protein [Cereibacter changlensis]
MTRLRIASYNVEWFNALFDNRDRLCADNEPSARYRITRREQAEALGIVFTALDADAVMVIEAPDHGSRRSTVKALESFAKTFGLRASKAIHGFTSGTEQEIALLYDPTRITARHDPQEDPKAPRFDRVFPFDIDVDAKPEPIRFSKPPLELALTADGRPLRMIGVHAKSKAPHRTRNPAEFSRISIDNRRKQLAQCVWIRRRVVGHLERGDSLIVLGDFNDGPGLDEYEKLFGQSGIEIVLGPEAEPPLQLTDPHARMALGQRVGVSPTTARFWLAPQERYFEALLDFIMVSPDLAAAGPSWRIWHPFNDPGCFKVPELRDALLAASDHFPVTLDL